MRHSIICSLILLFAGMASAGATFQFTLPGLQAPKDDNVADNGFFKVFPFFNFARR
jgi:hypothetical protein